MASEKKTVNWRCIGCSLCYYTIGIPIFVAVNVPVMFGMYVCECCGCCVPCCPEEGAPKCCKGTCCEFCYPAENFYEVFKCVNNYFLDMASGTMMYDPTKNDWKGFPVQQTIT